MKFSTISLCAILFATTVQAQTDMGESKTKIKMQSSETKTKGVVVGLVYSNLTKSQSRSNSEYISSNGTMTTDSQSMTSDIHVGLAGLNVGYKNYYAWGPLGFDASATVFKGINISEVKSNTTFYKIQSNVVYPFTNILSVAGGLNVSYADGLSLLDAKVEPGFGGQFGLQADVNSFGFMLGYQILGARIKVDSNSVGNSYTGTADFLTSGMVTQISYTF